MEHETKIPENVLLIRINRSYRPEMTPEQLYENTRGVWKIGVRREKADYAFAVYKGEVKEVYAIQEWYPAGTLPYHTRTKAETHIAGRWEFSGGVAEDEVRNCYLGASVADYFKQGAVSPVRYINC